MEATEDQGIAVPPTTTPPPAVLRVSQLVVQVGLLDQYDALIDAPGGPFIFRNNADGSAPQQLIAWLAQNFMTAETPPDTPEESAP